MVNPQTLGLQMTHHLERGRVASDHTLFQSLYAPFFPPFSKGDKDRSGLVPWAKAKVADRYPEELSPLWLSFSRDEQKENGDSEEIISLSLPPPHFPLFSLSLCTENLEQAFTLENNWLYLVVYRCFHRSWGYFGFGLQDSSFSSWGYFGFFGFELKMLGSFEIRNCFFFLFLGRPDIISLSINCSTSQSIVLADWETFDRFR